MHPDDPGWLDGVYQRYGQTIYSHSLRRIRDAENAADITIEAFMSAFKRRSQFTDERAIAGFLLQAADHWCDREIARAEGKDP